MYDPNKGAHWLSLCEHRLPALLIALVVLSLPLVNCKTFNSSCEVPKTDSPRTGKSTSANKAETLQKCSGTVHLVYFKDPTGQVSFDHPNRPKIDREWLETRAEQYRQIGLDAQVHESIDLRPAEHEDRRSQYSATKLMNRLHAQFPHQLSKSNNIVIGVLNADLYLRPKKNRQFRLSGHRRGADVAVVSGFDFGTTKRKWNHRLKTELARHVGRLLCEYPYSTDKTDIMYRGIDKPRDLDCLTPDLRTAE